MKVICPVLDINHIIGKKWAVILLNEIKGFNQFIKKSKMTPRTLSKQLKELEENNLIQKKDDNYFLTVKGKELIKITNKIKEWNIKYNFVSEKCLQSSCLECKSF